jgi:hypothetical protein
MYTSYDAKYAVKLSVLLSTTGFLKLNFLSELRMWACWPVHQLIRIWVRPFKSLIYVPSTYQ